MAFKTRENDEIADSIEKLIFLIGKRFNVIALSVLIANENKFNGRRECSVSQSKIMSYCREKAFIFNLFVTNLVRVENSILGVV